MAVAKVARMKACIIGLLLTLACVAEPLKWSISMGTSNGTAGRCKVIQSSGDILVEEWAVAGQAPKTEVTGYVNREELDILERMLADPQLHKASLPKPAGETRFLKFTYGEIKKTFIISGDDAKFPEPVEALSKEVARALSAAKQ